MSDTKLGVLLDESAERDAVHVAVAPVVAGSVLYPGASIGLRQDGQAVMTRQESSIGIVDPFLTTRVMPGDRFWLFLYPNTVTGMKHHWSHPAFDGIKPPQMLPEPYRTVTIEDQIKASEQWLREYASSHDVVNYEVMMEEVDKHVNQHIMLDWVTIHGYSAYAEIPPEFWTHYGNVRGKKIDEVYRATSFSCSC